MRARAGQRAAESSTHVSTVLPLTVPHSSRIFHLMRVRLRLSVARAGLRASVSVVSGQWSVVSGQWSVVRVHLPPAAEDGGIEE